MLLIWCGNVNLCIFLAFKYVFIDFTVPNFMTIHEHQHLKYKNNQWNLCVCVGISTWLFNYFRIRKKLYNFYLDMLPKFSAVLRRKLFKLD